MVNKVGINEPTGAVQIPHLDYSRHKCSVTHHTHLR